MQLIEQAFAGRDFELLGTLWVSGINIDWRRLYESGARTAATVSVPTYPFAKDRYWINSSAPKVNAKLVAASTTAALHTLLQTNTSDLTQQRYSATFSGDEFFLADHQVRADGHRVQKVLPGVACLEMARAAIREALPAQAGSATIELRNVVWAQPVIVEQRKQVSIAITAGERDEIDFEIYSDNDGEQVIHCQGRALTSGESAPARLDLAQLNARMTGDRIVADDAYPAFTAMGLLYGPAFRGLSEIRRGHHELLATLRLPNAVAHTVEDYVLHPSVMDSALQAALALGDGSMTETRPRLPFALESLRVFAACSTTMQAWVRYAQGSSAHDRVVKLDIDLCDDRGTICVQLRGFSSRVPAAQASVTAPAKQVVSRLLATPVWRTAEVSASAAPQAAVSERHLILCELPGVDVEALQSALPETQCVALPPDGQEGIAQRYTRYAIACFERIKSILSSKPQGKVLFRIAAATEGETALVAGLSGLLRTAALENPQFSGQLLLVPSRINSEELATKLNAGETDVDPLLRYENGIAEALRWEEIAADAVAPSSAFREDGVYLITGGLGSLGRLFAREILAGTPTARVVLTGRSPVTPETQSQLDSLFASSERVRYAQVNLGDARQVRDLIVSVTSQHGRLDGILHTAGMIADNFLLKKTSEEFAAVLEPKVNGTYNLDQASRDVPLDFFVLFSSYAGAFGNVGQGDYAAANGFMDHFAAFRNAQVAAGRRHGRTLSLDWPLWQEGGMGVDPASRELLQQATGMTPIETATGLNTFHCALTLPHAQLLLIEGELAQIRRILFDQPIATEAPSVASPHAAGIDVRDLAEKTQEYLRRKFSELLHLPPHKIDPRAALEQYGIDSILAMKLTGKLEKTFGSLSKTLFFEYQTIAELVEYFVGHYTAQLAALLAPAPHRAAERVATPAQAATTGPAPTSRRLNRSIRSAPAARNEDDPIAIIGLSGRYPEAVDVEAYW
ncbi:MAG TPA: SDR family NAD(P)-dependent oxidoreductase, partial [Thermoanaerobaculia bacterium]